MNLRSPAVLLVTLVTVLLLAACTARARVTQNQTLPTQPACFTGAEQSVKVNLEWAKTREQKRIGLMGRKELGERSGMMFDYRELQSARQSFWMRNTLIPLDIAYIDAQGTIVAINHMVPCDSVTGLKCPTYPAGAAYMQAIEMNAGFFERYQLTIGDKFEPDPANCSTSR